MKHSRLISGLALITILVGSMQMVLADTAAVASTKNNSGLYESVQDFANIMSLVKNNYVDEVDSKTLLENAIAGMLAGLDPHSAYLNKADFEELQSETTGEFGGLGIEISMEDGFIKVISPIDDTPAKRAGILPGDIIIRIDDKPIKGLNFNEAIELLRGKPGSTVTLTILRTNSDEPKKISLERAIIKSRSVRTKLIEKDFAYVRVAQFQSHTAADLEKGLTQLIKENKQPIKGLILDMRSNPGGVLQAAIDISDFFLDKGMIVSLKGRNINKNIEEYQAHAGDLLNGAPIVLLVNEGSASASEIVAGALKDHKRAVIMGQRTFGKGSVQTIEALGNGTAVKLTTARYYTPAGVSIQAHGIEPDIELKQLNVSVVNETLGSVHEGDLSRHLENLDDKKSKDDLKTNADLVESDFALYQALTVLKGMTLNTRNP
ncbi:MAG: S41 family peptidase [Gammaproteobacteria bacterium]|nr:S41 family peptidase [Gammaproteobacteria bacterium]